MPIAKYVALRSVAAVAFAVGILAFGYLGIVSLLHRASSESREEGLAVQAKLDAAHEFLSSWREQEVQLPTEEEFRRWRLDHPVLAEGPGEVEYFTDEFPEEIAELVGEPEPGEFVVAVRRGDRWQWDASAGARPARLSEGAPTRRIGLPSAVLSFVGVCALGLGIYCWKRVPN